ncbi:hypothetical protein AAFF_G00441070 [Aldrovandia affinis]|uniref:Uncharacterized protein n=1 Tax=Aldrovandia affinis TaxID=143900 RepID=A0AAD7WHS3_9TELE|nr:hypothetical protein AAFF_G00441070 [Aldrovandia affinis]
MRLSGLRDVPEERGESGPRQLSASIIMTPQPGERAAAWETHRPAPPALEGGGFNPLKTHCLENGASPLQSAGERAGGPSMGQWRGPRTKCPADEGTVEWRRAPGQGSPGDSGGLNCDPQAKGCGREDRSLDMQRRHAGTLSPSVRTSLSPVPPCNTPCLGKPPPSQRAGGEVGGAERGGEDAAVSTRTRGTDRVARRADRVGPRGKRADKCPRPEEPRHPSPFTAV